MQSMECIINYVNLPETHDLKEEIVVDVLNAIYQQVLI